MSWAQSLEELMTRDWKDTPLMILTPLDLRNKSVKTYWSQAEDDVAAIADGCSGECYASVVHLNGDRLLH